MKSKLYIYFIIIIIGFFLSCCEHKSGRKSKVQSQNKYVERTGQSDFSSNDKTIVKMNKAGGVFYIPCEINGVKMEFILDTGAGLISISSTEAMFLYKQEKLKDEDFIGTANFIDANGNISEGTVINLEYVKIGNRTLENIKASVVHNLNAPLLLGQSALERFGKVSIDYNRNEITFE